MGYPAPRVLPASQGLGCWGSELASGLFHHILLVEVNHWPVQVQREGDVRETHPFLMGDATELHQTRHGAGSLCPANCRNTEMPGGGASLGDFPPAHCLFPGTSGS